MNFEDLIERDLKEERIENMYDIWRTCENDHQRKTYESKLTEKALNKIYRKAKIEQEQILSKQWFFWFETSKEWVPCNYNDYLECLAKKELCAFVNYKEHEIEYSLNYVEKEKKYKLLEKINKELWQKQR